MQTDATLKVYYSYNKWVIFCISQYKYSCNKCSICFSRVASHQRVFFDDRQECYSNDTIAADALHQITGTAYK